MLQAATGAELCDLLAEGKAALRSSPIERVHNALTVLPRLVDALDRCCIYQTELRDVRKELTVAVRALRTEIWAAQRMHPEVTYGAAQIQRHMTRLLELLDRADRLLHS